MSINSLQKQTNINIQEKANLIWEIATHLVGLFKPHEYGKVILLPCYVIMKTVVLMEESLKQRSRGYPRK